MNFYLPDVKALCMAENATPPCTTSTACAARRYVTPRRGRSTSTRRSTGTATGRRRCSPRTSGRAGRATAATRSWRS
ncbi:hypothetical protein NKH77_17660 [Streptomyces sp. M19]